MSSPESLDSRRSGGNVVLGYGYPPICDVYAVTRSVVVLLHGCGASALIEHRVTDEGSVTDEESQNTDDQTTGDVSATER